MVTSNPRVFILFFLPLIEEEFRSRNEILSNDLQLLFCHLSRDGETGSAVDFYFRESGDIILTVVPRPRLLSMMAEPPWRSTIDFHQSEPEACAIGTCAMIRHGKIDRKRVANVLQRFLSRYR